MRFKIMILLVGCCFSSQLRGHPYITIYERLECNIKPTYTFIKRSHLLKFLWKKSLLLEGKSSVKIIMGKIKIKKQLLKMFVWNEIHPSKVLWKESQHAKDLRKSFHPTKFYLVAYYLVAFHLA